MHFVLYDFTIWNLIIVHVLFVFDILTQSETTVTNLSRGNKRKVLLVWNKKFLMNNSNLFMVQQKTSLGRVTFIFSKVLVLRYWHQQFSTHELIFCYLIILSKIWNLFSKIEWMARKSNCSLCLFKTIKSKTQFIHGS